MSQLLRNSTVTTLLKGVGHPQGPDVMDDGTIVYAETYLSRLMGVSPAGEARELLRCGGGPNAVIVGSDGCLYFTQNGGQAGDWRAVDQRPPALERFDLRTGKTVSICTAVGTRPLLAPHDLAWSPDGSLYMTDSGTWAPGGVTEPGAIIAIDGAGQARIVADVGHVFPSGIALTGDGTLFWAECYTRRIMKLSHGGEAEMFCLLPEGHTPESIAIDADGNLWVAALEAAGFDRIGPDGAITGFVHTGGLPLNGVLAGGRLYVTDLGDYDETISDPQIIGRIQAVDLGVEPGPSFRSAIVLSGETA